MNFDAQSFAEQIPYYLAQSEKVALAHALENWPAVGPFYIDRYPDEMLQGDSWTSLPIRNFDSGELALVDGIVLSNSCQIDASNSRLQPPKITIAPLIDLSRYENLLRKGDLSGVQIDAKMLAIREQRVHNIFYLPARAGIFQERIALLDDVYCFPLKSIDIKVSSRKKLATLSMVGFYVFIFKLSVHFCRLHENVERREIMG